MFSERSSAMSIFLSRIGYRRPGLDKTFQEQIAIIQEAENSLKQKFAYFSLIFLGMRSFEVGYVALKYVWIYIYIYICIDITKNHWLPSLSDLFRVIIFGNQRHPFFGSTYHHAENISVGVLKLTAPRLHSQSMSITWVVPLPSNSGNEGLG